MKNATLSAGRGHVSGGHMASPVRHALCRIALPLADACSLIALCIALSFLRLGSECTSVLEAGGLSRVAIFVICMMLCIACIGGYRQTKPLRSLLLAAEFLLAAGLGLLSALFVMNIVFLGTDLQSQSRMVLIFSTVCYLPVGILLRFAWEHSLESLGERKPVLFIGTGHASRSFEKVLERNGIPTITEYLLIDEPDAAEKFAPALTDAPSRYDSIVLDNNLHAYPHDLLENLIYLHFNEIPVLGMHAYFAAMHRQLPALDVDAAWIFSRDLSPAARPPYRYIKRLIDVTLSLAGILLLSPVFLVVAFAIWVERTGPVLFRQPRIGRSGRVFHILKFRTMVLGSDQGPAYTGDHDHRITRVGKILRRLHVDELPQLWNVFKGDMSLIGPRPEWDRLVKQYEQEIPFYHFRHLVRPGLTGWAQLNYPYGESVLDAEEKLRYDIYYIEYLSMVLDLEILLKTLVYLLFLRGK